MDTGRVNKIDVSTPSDFTPYSPGDVLSFVVGVNDYQYQGDGTGFTAVVTQVGDGIVGEIGEIVGIEILTEGQDYKANELIAYYETEIVETIVSSIDSISAEGTGYAVGEVVTLSGGNSDATATITSIGTLGEVTGIVLVDSGTGYTSSTADLVSSGTGLNATVTITSGNGTGTGAFISINSVNNSVEYDVTLSDETVVDKIDFWNYSGYQTPSNGRTTAEPTLPISESLQTERNNAIYRWDHLTRQLSSKGVELIEFTEGDVYNHYFGLPVDPNNSVNNPSFSIRVNNTSPLVSQAIESETETYYADTYLTVTYTLSDTFVASVGVGETPVLYFDGVEVSNVSDSDDQDAIASKAATIIDAESDRSASVVGNIITVVYDGVFTKSLEPAKNGNLIKTMVKDNPDGSNDSIQTVDAVVNSSNELLSIQEDVVLGSTGEIDVETTISPLIKSLIEDSLDNLLESYETTRIEVFSARDVTDPSGVVWYALSYTQREVDIPAVTVTATLTIK